MYFKVIMVVLSEDFKEFYIFAVMDPFQTSIYRPTFYTLPVKLKSKIHGNDRMS